MQVSGDATKMNKFILKYAFQFLCSALLMLIVAIWGYHLKELREIEERVWNVERAAIENKERDKTLEVKITNEKIHLEGKINDLCLLMNEQVRNLEKLINVLLQLNEIKAKAFSELSKDLDIEGG